MARLRTLIGLVAYAGVNAVAVIAGGLWMLGSHPAEQVALVRSASEVVYWASFAVFIGWLGSQPEARCRLPRFPRG